MIEKRLFYIWFGGEKPKSVQEALENWECYLPDFEIIEVNEKSSEFFDFEAAMKNDWFRTVYNRKMWAFASDYARLKVLYDFGGVYSDTDITFVKNISPLLQNSCFFGKEEPELATLGLFGSQKGHEFTKAMLEYYETDIWTKRFYTIAEISTYVLFKRFDIDFRKDFGTVNKNGVTVYDIPVFYPYHYSQTFSEECITPETYTVHWWKELSWQYPEDLEWLKTKHTRTREKNIKTNF